MQGKEISVVQSDGDADAVIFVQLMLSLMIPMS